MTRVISLSDEAYNELKNLKKEDESFSDVVIKIIAKEKKPLTDFFGRWPGPKEETGKLEKEFRRARKKAKMRSAGF